MNKEENNENFINYNDVKTKTINWCTKMQSEGLLTPEQYDDCVSTFRDIRSGILPKEFKVPDTGMDTNYSLYNTRSEKLNPKLTNENTNTVMLVTNTGEYMACNSNNELYFVRNINNSNLNQQELYFVLLPQNNNVYVIMSPYGKYLISNTEWGATFSGTSIGNMSSWNISKINNKVIFESIQFAGFYLSFKNNSDKEPLKIIYGKNNTIQWLLLPKKETQLNNKYGEYTGFELINEKEQILSKIKNLKVEELTLQNIIKNAETLNTTIIDKFENISLHIVNILNNKKKNYIRYANYFKNSRYGRYYKSLNNNLTEEIILGILNNIQNKGTHYSEMIQEKISKMKSKLLYLEKEIETQLINYDKFLLNIKSELANTKQRIQQNNLIMGRQQDNYEKLDEDVAYISAKQNKYETLDEKLKLNLEIVDGYKQQTSLLVKIYPVILVILILLVIYLIYLTSIKFMDNIYYKY